MAQAHSPIDPVAAGAAATPAAPRRVAACTAPPAGRRRPFLLALLALALLLPANAAAQPGEALALPDGRQPSPAEWSELLQEHAQGFSQARHAHRQARRWMQAGDLDRAEQLLIAASDHDRRFAAAHFDRARIDARRLQGTAIAGWLSGVVRSFEGWRNQARLVGNALLLLDLILVALLLWLLVVLGARYLPFAHHQLASRLERSWHQARRAQLLWIPLLVPLCLGWGLVPLVAVALPLCFVYGGRRARVALGLVAGLLALQGSLGGTFGAALSGLDPSSRPSLVYRASYEPAGEALLGEIDLQLDRRTDDADLHFARGLVLARMGRFDASNESFLQCLELRPGDARSTANIASNHYFLGHIDRAVSGYQKSAALDSTLGGTYYNLSQAYIRKLYLKEGGEAMQRALRNGFKVTRQEESLPRGSVYYQRPSNLQFWQMAWGDRDRLQPSDLLAPYQRWLGVPAQHVGAWLAAALLLGFALALLNGREKLVFECVNCGELACGRCKGEHEGAVLCSHCAGHARRAKSEMVLTTLLRNRRRDAEVAYHSRLRHLDFFLPGAGRLYNGVQRRGLAMAAWGSACAVLALLGGPVVADPWAAVEPGTWTTTRIAGLAGLGLLLVVNQLSRWSGRSRHLHAHPSSIVSLVGLIEGREGRTPKGAKA